MDFLEKEKRLNQLGKILTNGVENDSMTESLKFFKRLEDFIIEVNNEGFTEGYEKGVEMKNIIKSN